MSKTKLTRRNLDTCEGSCEVDEEAPADRQVVLHEDKKYYPEASEVRPQAAVLMVEFAIESLCSFSLFCKCERSRHSPARNLTGEAALVQ